eukprot:2515816-Pyramimonas_sp.AAC.1
MSVSSPTGQGNDIQVAAAAPAGHLRGMLCRESRSGVREGGPRAEGGPDDGAQRGRSGEADQEM